MRVVVKKLPLLLCIVLICCFITAGQESDAATEPVGIVELYLAKDDGAGNAGDQATVFVATDVPIHCVVQLDSFVAVNVKMNLVAVAVPGVKAETKVVSAVYTTKDGQSRVNFSGRPVGRWVAGRYRVDIFVGNAPAESREFTVLKSATTKVPSKPANDKSRLAGPVTKNP